MNGLYSQYGIGGNKLMDLFLALEHNYINAATAIVKKLWTCNHMNFGN